MKKLLAYLFSIAALLTIRVAFAQVNISASDTSPGIPTSVTTLQGFENVTATLTLLVKEKKGHAINHFCVVGYKVPHGTGFIAWVHWLEKKSLVLWEPVTSGQKVQLSRSRRYLNLATDVVEREEDDAHKGQDHKKPQPQEQEERSPKPVSRC